MSDLFIAEDGKPRCKWCSATAEYIDYHDNEWGYPVLDDRKLFEKICLESFQSGLSWRTILAKRENFRKAFKNFEIDQVAKFDNKEIELLLQDKGIVRHRGKIEAVINNAKCAQQLIKEEGSLAEFIWKFVPENYIKPQVRSTSEESVQLSKILKKRGWKFVGPTTIYAFFQAMGLVNDHSEGCFVRDKVEKAKQKLI